MAVELQQKIISFVREVVIPEERKENPKFSEKNLDASFRATDDDFWEVASISPNGKLDYQEGLNFSLFKYDNRAKRDVYAEKFESYIGLDVPWYLSPAEGKDPDVAKKIGAIDQTILILDAIIKNGSPQNISRAKYERKMAIGLMVFLYHHPTEKGEIEEGFTELLKSEGMIDFAYAVAGLRNTLLDCDKQLCGLSENGMSRPLGHEETVYDRLKNNRGDCSEASYLFRLAAGRAGLNAGFAVASTTLGGFLNHQYNIVYLSDGTSLSIDTARGSVNETYTKTKPVDDYEALAGYYRGKAQAGMRADKSAAIIDQYFQISLSLDPTNPHTHLYYASFLDDNYRSDEASKHFDLMLRYGGDKDIVARLNFGNELVEDGKFNEAKPHFQYAYDNLKPLIDKDKEDKVKALTSYRYADAALGLGKVEEAILFCRKAIEMDPSQPIFFTKYADALKIRGDNESLIEAKGIYEGLMDTTFDDRQDLSYAVYGYFSLFSDLQTKGLVSPEELEKSFRLALEKQPDSFILIYNYMVSLHNNGRDNDKCLKVARQITQLPLDKQYHHYLATAYEIQGSSLLGKGLFDEARIMYEKAINFNPASATAYNNYAVCFQELADKKTDPQEKKDLLIRAEEQFKKACKLDSSLPSCKK
jgi:tetratricopeptide (TPR) repeat protein